MCGDYDSSLGMEKEEPINRFISKMPRAASRPPTVRRRSAGWRLISRIERDWRRKLRRCDWDRALETVPDFW